MLFYDSPDEYLNAKLCFGETFSFLLGLFSGAELVNTRIHFISLFFGSGAFFSIIIANSTRATQQSVLSCWHLSF